MILFEYIFGLLGLGLTIVNVTRSCAYSKETKLILGGSYLRYRCFKPTIETKAELEGGDENDLGEVEKNMVKMKLPMTIKGKEANKRKGILNSEDQTPNKIQMQKMIETSKRKMINLKKSDLDEHF